MSVLPDITLPRTLDQWKKALPLETQPGATVEGWLFEGRRARRAPSDAFAPSASRPACTVPTSRWCITSWKSWGARDWPA